MTSSLASDGAEDLHEHSFSMKEFVQEDGGNLGPVDV